MDKNFANSVLNEMVKRGNSADEIHKRLGSLDAEQQKTFISQAAAKLGMGDGARPKMNFTPDAVAQTSQGEVVGRNLAQGATRQFGDELQPLAEKGIAKLSQLTGIGPQDVAERTLAKPYGELVEENRQEIRETEAAQPELAMLMKFAGGLATSGPEAAMGPVTGGLVAGTLEGVGSGEGAADSAVKGVVGGALGAGMGAVVKGASMLPKLGAAIKNEARNMSVRMLKLKPSEIEHTSLKRLNKLGDMLLESGSTKGPARLKTIAGRVETETDAAGAAIKQIYKDLSAEMTPINAKQFMGMIDERLTSDQTITRSSTLQGARGQLSDFVSRLGDRHLTVDDIWEIAKRMEKEAKVFERSTDATQNSQAMMLKDLARKTRDFLADRFENIAPDQAGAIRELNGQFNLLSDANDALQLQVKQGMFRGRPSVREVSTRVIDAATGGTVSRSALVSAGDLVGRALQKPAKLGKFAKILQEAQNRGAASLASTHYVLSQTDPDYQEKMSKLAEESE